jgi:hypothetical protein
MHIRSTRLLVLALLMLALTGASFAGIFVSITVAPPALPVYEQPVCPTPGYMWSPGYWSWGDDGYFWVPGTWVPAPAVGLLWTPGYWGWSGGYYRWNAGYWGPHIGFYGGVSYGYGYGGVGFVGGEWRNGGFFYNSAVMHVGGGGGFSNNVYVNRTVIVNNTTVVNNVSFNGGTGGVQAQPTATEQAAAHENHVQPTAQQTQHETAAAKNPQLLAKNNGGKPAIAATAKAGDFSPKSVVPAKAAGGKIPPETLAASSKNMPAAPKTAAATPKTAVAARPAGGGSNVPKPPNASAPKPVATKPAASNPAQPSRNTTSTPAAHTSTPPAAHTNAAPARTAAPPAHAAAPPPKPASKPANKPTPKENERK